MPSKWRMYHSHHHDINSIKVKAHIEAFQEFRANSKQRYPIYICRSMAEHKNKFKISSIFESFGATVQQKIDPTWESLILKSDYIKVTSVGHNLGKVLPSKNGHKNCGISHFTCTYMAILMMSIDL